MPTSAGNPRPVRGHTEVIKVFGVFDVGASGAHTYKYGNGITSVAKTATGEYDVTFAEGARYPVLLDLDARYHTVADEETLLGHYIVDSYVRSTGVAKFEINEVDETEALVEPASGSDCYIEVTFLKTT